MKISLPPINIERLKNLLPEKYRPDKLASLITSLTAPKEVMKAAEPLRVLSCDFGASKIILLEALKENDQITVEHFDLIARPDEPGKAAEKIKEVLSKGYNSKRVRVSVKGQSVIVRFVQFPKMKLEELRSAIIYEAENYIPFKIDEVLLDFSIIEESMPGSEMMNVLLIAVKKEEIYPLIKEFQDADLSLDLIDIDTLASINALEYFYPEEFKNGAALLDLGKEISSLCVIRDSKPQFIRDISYGGLDIQKRLRRKLGLSSADAEKVITHMGEASPEALQVLKEGYETLCSDLKVTLDYYQGQIPDAKRVEHFFLSGGAGDPKLMAGTLSTNLGIPVQGIDMLSKIKLASTVDKALFEKNQRLLAVAMGLVLRRP